MYYTLILYGKVNFICKISTTAHCILAYKYIVGPCVSVWYKIVPHSVARATNASPSTERIPLFSMLMLLLPAAGAGNIQMHIYANACVSACNAQKNPLIHKGYTQHYTYVYAKQSLAIIAESTALAIQQCGMCCQEKNKCKRNSIECGKVCVL